MSAVILGRRDRKRLAARAAIVDASTQLFVEHGFEQTRIEAIAARADVGVGSVYTHFAAKTDILVAILTGDARAVVDRTRAIVERGEPDASRLMSDVAAVLLEVMERRPRDLWQDLIGHALLDRGDLHAAYHRVERLLHGLIVSGLARLRENGKLEASMAIEDAADIIFALAKNVVYQFVFDHTTAVPTILATLERQLRLAFGARQSDR